ncbi:MAG: hypothetical protein O3A21_09410 [Proteobacteria bacterium]|nr:hypothetical protein [Pseudomonadota bacterium]
MNPLLTKLVGHVVRRVAADPVARRHVATAAKKVAGEARDIAKSGDPAFAAGQAVRRTLNKLKHRDGE